MFVNFTLVIADNWHFFLSVFVKPHRTKQFEWLHTWRLEQSIKLECSPNRTYLLMYTKKKWNLTTPRWRYIPSTFSLWQKDKWWKCFHVEIGTYCAAQPPTFNAVHVRTHWLYSVWADINIFTNRNAHNRQTYWKETKRLWAGSSMFMCVRNF